MENALKKRRSRSKRHRNMSYFAYPGINSMELIRLLYLVSRHTGIEASVIRSRNQSREAATARHLFTHIARRQYNKTYQFIADFLRRSSHSTIKKSEEQACNFLDTDKEFQVLYQRVIDAINRERKAKQKTLS